MTSKSPHGLFRLATENLVEPAKNLKADKCQDGCRDGDKVESGGLGPVRPLDADNHPSIPARVNRPIILRASSIVTLSIT